MVTTNLSELPVSTVYEELDEVTEIPYAWPHHAEMVNRVSHCMIADSNSALSLEIFFESA